MLSRKPFLAGFLTALSILTMLSGCAVSAAKSAPAPAVDLAQTGAEAIPELSRSDALRCYDPGVPGGVDALKIIADHRVALSDCRQRHARVVAQYNDIKGVLAPPKDDAQE